MMKKIMLTTALASSMLFAATYANAEAKMSGTLEATLGSGEAPAVSTKTNQGTTIGWEANLSVSGTKELDSGLTMAMGANLESASTNTFDAPYMTFTSGNTTFGLAQDTVFTIDDSTIVPSVDGNNIEDANKGLGISFKHNGITIHDSNLMGISHKTDFGSLQVVYSPKVDDSSMGNDSSPGSVTKSGSGTAVGFKGSLGVEGLTAVAYTNKRSTSGLDAQEISSNSIGATYNFGSFKVGAQQTSYDDVAGTALTTYSNGASADAKSYGLTFAATDQLSLGINYAELSGTSVTTDEETTSVTAGYDLGGALVSVRWTEVQNKGGTANTDGEAIELRIKQAF
jgi:hypothetical protein